MSTQTIEYGYADGPPTSLWICLTVIGALTWLTDGPSSLDHRDLFVKEIRNRGGAVEIEAGVLNWCGRLPSDPQVLLAAEEQKRRRCGQVLEVTLPNDANLSDARRMSLLAETPVLKISSDRFDDPAFLALPNFTRLSYVVIRSNSLTPQSLVRMRDWRSLSTVHVEGEKMNDDIVDALLQCRISSGISVVGSRVGNEGARRLLAHPSAKSLGLDGLGLTEECVGGLTPEAITLAGASIAGNRMSDSGTAFFYRIPTLTYLDTSTSIHGAKAIAAIRQNKSLRSLTIDDISGDLDWFFQALSRHPRITDLSVKNVRLSRWNLRNILLMPNLSKVDLSGCHVDESLVESVREELERESYFNSVQIIICDECVRSEAEKPMSGRKKEGAMPVETRSGEEI